MLLLLKAVLASTLLALAVAGLLLALLALAFVVVLLATMAAAAVLMGLVIAVLIGAAGRPAAPLVQPARWP